MDSPALTPEDDDDFDHVFTPGNHNSSPPAADESMSSSGAHTPHRSKKRVEWRLPAGDDALDQQAQDPSSTSDARDDQIEELRRSLSRSLPSHDRNASSSAPRGHLSPPSQQPRSVMKSGRLTPLPSDIDNGVENLEVKIRSASDAQLRAHRITEDVSRDVSRETSANTSRANSPERHSRRYQRKHKSIYNLLFHPSDKFASGTFTPEQEMEDLEDFAPQPKAYRAAGLSAFNLQAALHAFHQSRRHSGGSSGMSSGTTSPRSTSPNRRGITSLVGKSIGLGAVGSAAARPAMYRFASEETVTGIQTPPPRPSFVRSGSNTILDQLGSFSGKFTGHKSSRIGSETSIAIKKHIQDTVRRQRFLNKLCRALMLYGAPTHRLEEYMKASARVLETEAQFLYIPGCMIVSFDDSQTHTAEIRLVRTTQGVDLGKLRDTHEVYKDVVHDDVGVEEAGKRLDDIMKRKDKFPVWVRVIVYGFASMTVGPFAFQARLIDLPIAFILGCLLGFLQLVVSNLTDLYTSVFEIIAVLLTSFLARFFGSLQGGQLFCFSALAQSSIALILPGYTVLCGALELQSKSITAGAVRLVYAVIYSLFIGFGLTLGIAIYGVIDGNATSATTCGSPIASDGYLVFISVPLYTICLMIINQAKYSQMPFMLLVSFTGYIVNYFSAQRFSGNPQVSAAFASLAIAFMANINSRAGHRIVQPLEKVFKKAYFWLAHYFVPNIGKLQDMPTDSEIEMQPTASTLSKGWRPLFGWAHHDRQEVPASAQSSRHGSVDSSALGDDNPETLKNKSPVKEVRVQYGLAAAAMLPAIFVLVPSGLAVSGSLISGIQTGNEIAHNTTGTIPSSQQVFNGQAASNTIAFGVGYSVVQIAIGITVGLFLGTLAAYPLGKGRKVMGRKETRSGIFSF